MANVISPLFFLSGTLFYGSSIGARDQILQKEYNSELRATMGSIIWMLASLFYAGIALLLGITADRYGLVAGVVLGIGLGALTIPMYCLLQKRLKEA